MPSIPSKIQRRSELPGRAPDLLADHVVVRMDGTHGGEHRLLDVEVDLRDGRAVDLVRAAQLLRSEVAHGHCIGGVGQVEGSRQFGRPCAHGLGSSL